MENIYYPRYKHVINVKEKFDEFRAKLMPSSVEALGEELDPKQLVNFTGDDEEFEALEDSISLEHLAQPDDIRVSEFNPIDLNQRKRNATVEFPKKAMLLKSVRYRIDNQADVTAQSRIRGFKYNKYKFMRVEIDNDSGSCDLFPLEEVLLVVRVYEPFRYNRGDNTALRKPRLSQEFAVLGSQILTELRDKIYCQCNYGPFFDLSEDFDSIERPREELTQTSPTSSKGPGFFFITDTFYNDNRYSNIDYSTEIREWMGRQKDIDVKIMKTAPMDCTRFESLNVRIGFPQVYRHHGICEHLFTFSDIRLLSSHDSLKRCDYPIMQIVSSTKTQLCLICGGMEATFIVRKSTAHIHDPAFLCKNCLISYHYVNREKVGEFEVYRYYGNRPIVN